LTLPLYIVSIEPDGLHLWVEVLLNNKPAIMVVDSGASRTCFDITRIRKFVPDEDFELHSEVSTGLGTNSMQSHVTIIENFSIGSILLKQYKTILIDLFHVNDSYEKLDLGKIDGVLGSDLLARYGAVIDYKFKKLVLSKEEVL
jgi:hypothetical protein